jgi:hypothetical protein
MRDEQPFAAARWYSEAFAAQPKLADDLNAGHRYEAACAAALAGVSRPLTGCGRTWTRIGG